MFIHCRRITVVHIHVNVFFQDLQKITQRVTVIKPASDQNGLKHAVLALKKGKLGCQIIRVRCTKCSYNTIATSIGLLDKITIFVCTGKFSYE